MRRTLLQRLVQMLLVLFLLPVQAGGEQLIPIFTGREIVGPAGRLAPDGLIDYLKLLNLRDGGVNGVRLTWEECETAFEDARGIACFERAAQRGAALVLPLSSGISYALTERSRSRRIPMVMVGYGRADASDGRAFPYAFPLVTNLLSQAVAQIRFIGTSEGGIDKLQGKRIAYLYLDIPTGREALDVLESLADEHGFSLARFPIPLPGTDQQTSWNKIQAMSTDWVLLAGPGQMTPAALIAAAAVQFPANRIIGFGLSAAEQDVQPAGLAGTGYIAVAFNPSGSNFPVIREIIRYVHPTRHRDELVNLQGVGSAYYVRGVLQGILISEAMRVAQRHFGRLPLSGEQMQWGLERISLDDERLEKLGARELLPPLLISCRDHEGGGAVKFQQWLGNRWNLVSDWISGDSRTARRLIEVAALRYAESSRHPLRSCEN